MYVLFGLFGFGFVFMWEYIEMLCDYIGKFIVFSFFNLISKVEIIVFDVYIWFKGKCLFVVGLLFDLVVIDGKMYMFG